MGAQAPTRPADRRPTGVLSETSARGGAAETPECFLLAIGRGTAYFLPKRAVGDAAEHERVRALLRTHLGARAASLANRTVAPAG